MVDLCSSDESSDEEESEDESDSEEEGEEEEESDEESEGEESMVRGAFAARFLPPLALVAVVATPRPSLFRSISASS